MATRKPAKRQKTARPKANSQPAWQRWYLAAEDAGVAWAQGQWERFHRCRECGGEVAFTDDVCPHCGVRPPVLVPVSLPATLGMLAIIVICLTHWIL